MAKKSRSKAPISAVFDPGYQRAIANLSRLEIPERRGAGREAGAVGDPGYLKALENMAGMNVAERRPVGREAGGVSDPGYLQALENMAGMEVAERRPVGREAGGVSDPGYLQALENMAGMEIRVPRRGGTEGTEGTAGIGEVAAKLAEAEIRAALHVIKNSLNGGEISEEMAARFDQARYQTGLAACENMVPLPCGGIGKRPGFAAMGEAGGAVGRLLPFIFSSHESRMLEFYEAAGGVAMRAWLPDGTRVDTGLVLPWRPEWLADVKFCQSADVIYCASIHFPPGKIMRYGDHDWRYADVRFTPNIEAPRFSSVWCDCFREDGDNTWTCLYYVCTAVNEDGEESAPSAVWTIWGIAQLSSTYFTKLGVYETPGAVEYRFYKRSAGVYGFIGRIESPTDIFEDRNIAPDTSDTPPSHKNPFEKQGDWPSVVFSHQQRLGWAATENHPMTLWLSPSGIFESMAASTPPADDDAIEATLAALQANAILWARSDRAGLCIGTTSGEWLLEATDSAALTPANLSFAQQTCHGSQPGLDPVMPGSTILFAQRGGRVVRDLGYNFQADRYQSVDLSLLARHILKKAAITAWAWQPEPYGILWMCLEDGSLAGLTYLRDHEIVSWHRHDTGAAILDLATIPAPNGNWQLWARASRQGRIHIERMTEFEEHSHADGPERQPVNGRVVLLLPEPQDATSSTFLAVKKINSIKARVLNCAPFTARVISQDAEPSPDMPLPPKPAGLAALADWATPFTAGWRDFPRVELNFKGGQPATVLGVVIAMETGNMNGGQ